MIEKAEAGVLYPVFVEADRLRRKALAAGETREVANALVSDALQAAWPKGREAAWRYLCDLCGDSGWRSFQCPETPCEREKQHQAHDYVRQCWCEKGRALTPKPRGETDELATVGKIQKPSRFGR